MGRMQVEVSKYTEGLSDKRMRPNELPVSLIRYDGESPAANATPRSRPPYGAVQTMIMCLCS